MGVTPRLQPCGIHRWESMDVSVQRVVALAMWRKLMTLRSPSFYTIQEAARILRCSTKTVRRQIARGHLLATKPKGLRIWLIPETAIKDWLNQGVPDGR